jgi:hypothetical protein
MIGKGFINFFYSINRYPHYHRSTDLPQYLVPAMAYQILKMNLAAMATLLGY